MVSARYWLAQDIFCILGARHRGVILCSHPGITIGKKYFKY